MVDRSFLSDLFLPMGVVFFLWWLQGVAIEPWLRQRGFELYWYDTDWLAATLALSRRSRSGPSGAGSTAATSLVLHLAAGWWAGFLILVLVLRPAHDSAARRQLGGCLGMTAGLLWYCRQTGLWRGRPGRAVCGFIGGIGFAAASMLKLVEVTSGYQTNWHSILEQTTGLFNGIGLAVAVAALARCERHRSPNDREPARRWTEPFALGFVLLGITYLNLRKNVANGSASRRCRPRWPGIAPGPGSTWDTSCWRLTLLRSWFRHTQAAAGDRAGELARQGAVALSRAALVAGRRQLRTCTGRLHGRAARDRRA